jgi:hypothetical protein
MGQASEIHDILISRQYDLHGAKLALARAMEGQSTPEHKEALRVKVMKLKEEIHTLSEMLRFRGYRN